MLAFYLLTWFWGESRRCSPGRWALPTEPLSRPIGGGGSEPLPGQFLLPGAAPVTTWRVCRGPRMADRGPVACPPPQAALSLQRWAEMAEGPPELPAGPCRGSVLSCHHRSHSTHHPSNDQSPSLFFPVPWTLSPCSWPALPRGTGPGIGSIHTVPQSSRRAPGRAWDSDHAEDARGLSLPPPPGTGWAPRVTDAWGP